jgi:hypothetical protein
MATYTSEELNAIDRVPMSFALAKPLPQQKRAIGNRDVSSNAPLGRSRWRNKSRRIIIRS